MLETTAPSDPRAELQLPSGCAQDYNSWRPLRTPVAMLPAGLWGSSAQGRTAVQGRASAQDVSRAPPPRGNGSLWLLFTPAFPSQRGCGAVPAWLLPSVIRSRLGAGLRVSSAAAAAFPARLPPSFCPSRQLISCFHPLIPRMSHLPLPSLGMLHLPLVSRLLSHPPAPEPTSPPAPAPRRTRSRQSKWKLLLIVK